MNKRTPMIKDRKSMHKRLTMLCKKLNSENRTNLSNVLSELKIGLAYHPALQKSKIVYKVDSYWRGSERLTDNKLNEFISLMKADIKKRNSHNVKGQSTITFPKSNNTSKKVKIKKIGLIQRFKILLTGKL
jgi:hypothetical protein